MQRRGLLKLGLGAGAALAGAAGAVGWFASFRARQEEQFEPELRILLMAVGGAVLAGLLPDEPHTKDLALRSWLTRLETTVAGMPPVVQNELDDLLLILATSPGRLALAGLRQPWHAASTQQVQAALQGLRMSSLAIRQQIFHALRDLSNAAYFAAPESWAAIGYPGPLKV